MILNHMMVREIALRVSHEIKDSYKGDRPKDFGRKHISTHMSRLFELHTPEVLTEMTGMLWLTSNSDNDADVFTEDRSQKLEIKVTADDRGWTGNKVSKRPGNYMLVRYVTFEDFFITGTYLEEEDWTHCANVNYCGTSLTKNDLFHKKQDRVDFMGSLIFHAKKVDGTPRMNPYVSWKMESIDSTDEEKERIKALHDERFKTKE